MKVCEKCIQWTPSNPAILGTSQSVLIGGVASGEFALGSMPWDILNTGVASFQIRGSPYNSLDLFGIWFNSQLRHRKNFSVSQSPPEASADAGSVNIAGHMTAV